MPPQFRIACVYTVKIGIVSDAVFQQRGIRQADRRKGTTEALAKYTGSNLRCDLRQRHGEWAKDDRRVLKAAGAVYCL